MLKEKKNLCCSLIYFFLIGKHWKHMDEKSTGRTVSVLKHLSTNEGVWEMSRMYQK